MFASIISGAGLLSSARRALTKYPVLLMPLLCCWLCNTPVIIYLKFVFDWDFYSTGQQLLVSLLAILFFSLTLSLACLILLKLIQQIEGGEPLRLGVAVGQGLLCLLDALPITFAWALIWFVISLLASVFDRGEKENEEVDAESIAETLSGYEDSSLAMSFFAALNKGVRMVVFLIFVAMAWEQNSVSRAVRRGLAVVKTHEDAFVVGFLLTELAAVLMFVPASLLFVVHHKLGVELPEWVWFVTIVYCAGAWSLSMFLEQLFTAELYLWHLMWEETTTLALSEGRPKPALHEIRRPSIMDDIADLTHIRLPGDA